VLCNDVFLYCCCLITHYDDDTIFVLVASILLLGNRQAWINNEKSGTHDDFHMFIMGLPWILFYHDQMKELGDFSTTYSTLAYPCLPEDVFLTSDGSSNSSSTNSNKKIKIKIGHKN